MKERDGARFECAQCCVHSIARAVAAVVSLGSWSRSMRSGQDEGGTSGRTSPSHTRLCTLETRLKSLTGLQLSVPPSPSFPRLNLTSLSSSSSPSRMSSPTLSLSYRITLPASHTPSTALPTSASFSLPLSAPSPLAHLIALEAALGDARDRLNEDLTVWKDELRVFEKEKEKEGKRRAEEDGEEEEEEEEEEE